LCLEKKSEKERRRSKGCKKSAFILPGKFSVRRKKHERRSKGLGFRCKKKETKERRR